MLGWQAALLSAGFVIGTIIQGLIVLNNPSYVFQRWHGTLLFWAVTGLCVAFNTFFAKKLPAVEAIVLFIHFAGLFAIVIPLWILAPRATATEALLTFSNGGGWPTTGLSAMIGLITPMGSLLGFDCAVHMCRYPTSIPGSTDADLKPSGRDRRCWPHYPKLNHVVCHPERSNGLPDGHNHVLLPWGPFGSCRLPNRVSVHPSVLQRNTELRCHQRHGHDHDHRPCRLLHQSSSHHVTTALVFCS